MNSVGVRRAAYLAALMMLLWWVSMPATSADLPEEWIAEALEKVDEGDQGVVKNHIESQLDWRSYYLDRQEARRRMPPPSRWPSQEPFSPIDRQAGAGDTPACSGKATRPNGETGGAVPCRRVEFPT